jgi:hypothetical protein
MLVVAFLLYILCRITPLLSLRNTQIYSDGKLNSSPLAYSYSTPLPLLALYFNRLWLHHTKGLSSVPSHYWTWQIIRLAMTVQQQF